MLGAGLRSTSLRSSFIEIDITQFLKVDLIRKGGGAPIRVRSTCSFSTFCIHPNRTGGGAP